jgi:hypothetical protein
LGCFSVKVLQTEFFASRVSDGTRTRDRLDHNQELYLLSYAHRGSTNLAVERAAAAGSS